MRNRNASLPSEQAERRFFRLSVTRRRNSSAIPTVSALPIITVQESLEDALDFSGKQHLLSVFVAIKSCVDTVKMSKILKNTSVLRQVIRTMSANEGGSGKPGAAGGSIRAAGGRFTFDLY